MNICFDIEMDKSLFDDKNILKYELLKPVTNELIGILIINHRQSV